MLTSNNSKFSEFFTDDPKVFLDTCAITKIIKDFDQEKVFNKILQSYGLIFCTISLIEIGFGPTSLAHEKEKEIIKMIYSIKNSYHIDSEKIPLKQRSGEKYVGNIFLFNPTHHEWLSARTNLIMMMNSGTKNTKNATLMRHDSLFLACSFNSRSILITENTKDFKSLNSSFKSGYGNHEQPFFSVDELIDSFKNEVSFPENLE